MLLLKIKCVKKEGNFVTEITGMIAPDASDRQPEQRILRATDQPWDVHWRHPRFGDILIGQGTFTEPHTNRETKYFVALEPPNLTHNLLEDFSNC